MEDIKEEFAKRFGKYTVKDVSYRKIEASGNDCVELLKEVIEWNNRFCYSNNMLNFEIKNYRMITHTVNKCRVYPSNLANPPEWW